MSDDIGFKIYAVIDGLKDSMSQASESVKTFADSATKNVESLSGGFKALGQLTEAYLALLAVEKVDAFFDKFAEQATQINRLSLEFGIASNEVQGLQFAMSEAGGSGDQLQSLLSRLSVAMEKAIDNAGPQRTAFENMGISLKFLQENANNVPAVLDELADAVKRAGAGSQVTAELIPLMGRGAASIVPVLAEGSEGLRAMQRAAEDTGGVMDESTKNQFLNLHKSIVTMNEAFNGFGQVIASAFAPAFQALIDGITELVSALNGGSEHVSIFRDALLLVVVPLDAIVVAVELVKVALVVMWQTMTLVTDGIVYEFKALGLVISDFLHGDFAKMGPDWDTTMAEMDRVTKEHVTTMKNEITDLGKTVGNMGKGIAGLVGGAGGEQQGPPAPPVKTGQTSEELAAAQAEQQQEMALAQEKVSFDEQMAKTSLQTKKDALDAGVAAGTISKQQEIEQLKTFATEEYTIEDTALAQKEALYQQGTVEYQKALDARLILAAKHQQDLAKLDAQSAQVEAQQNKQITDTISKDFDTMLQGVLQGTQTWQQAMARLFDNLILSWIEAEAKLVVKWAVDEATKTAATVAGNAERTTSTVGAQSTGLAAQAIGAQKSVGMSAGQAAASVYADVAAIPYVGWLLAPPAAAAAFVAVEAFGAGFSASGGFDVPSGTNPVTQLHQREMVLPADLADGVRGMVANGGSSSNNNGGQTPIQINISAIDTQSGMTFIQSQGAAIANEIQRQMRNANPALSKMRA